jgi:iron complex outermembrane receptor protein
LAKASGPKFYWKLCDKKRGGPQGAKYLDVDGEVGSASGLGSQELKINLKATYVQGPWGVFTQLRYIGSGKYNITFGPVQLSSSDNNIGAQSYLGLSTYYKFKTDSLENVEIYAGINNALDRDPPAVPTDCISNVANYDVIGRSYYAGVILLY